MPIESSRGARILRSHRRADREFVDRFKCLADEKKIVTDADMEAIVSDELYKPEPVWTLRSVRI